MWQVNSILRRYCDVSIYYMAKGSLTLSFLLSPKKDQCGHKPPNLVLEFLKIVSMVLSLISAFLQSLGHKLIHGSP